MISGGKKDKVPLARQKKKLSPPGNTKVSGTHKVKKNHTKSKTKKKEPRLARRETEKLWSNSHAGSMALKKSGHRLKYGDK